MDTASTTAADPLRLAASDLRKLRRAAHRGRRRGWWPYSRFAVGAAVLTKDGRVCAGPGNVECANYSLTKHAEETAVNTALSRGAFERRGPFCARSTSRPVAFPGSRGRSARRVAYDVTAAVEPRVSLRRLATPSRPVDSPPRFHDSAAIE